MPTLYENHKLRWSDCHLCSLCKGRRNVVLARGSLPCDMLFCGEAPGMSEDSSGLPFHGPAGKLLDRIIAAALGDPPEWRLAFTNLVACFPRQQKEQGDRQPPEEAIRACARRLREFVTLAEPQLVVAVGSLARDWIDPNHRHCALPGLEEQGIMTAHIAHPSAVLQAPVASQSLMVKRCVAILQNAASNLVPF